MTRELSYWEKAAITKYNYFNNRAIKFYRSFLDDYKDLNISIRNNLSQFYGKYGSITGNKVVVNLNNAKKYLSPVQVEHFKNTLRDYTPAALDIRMKSMTATLLRRKRIKRQEKLIWDNERIISDNALKINNSTDTYLSNIAKLGFLYGIYDVQKYNKGTFSFSLLSKSKIKEILDNPWSGATYSSRIWKNKDTTAIRVRELITKGFVQNKTLNEVSKELSKITNTSFKQSKRLIRSETKYVYESALKESVLAIGEDSVEISSILDERSIHYPTYNGRRFKINSPEAASLTPPIEFPNCRCMLIPVITKGRYVEEVDGRFPSFDSWNELYV